MKKFSQSSPPRLTQDGVGSLRADGAPVSGIAASRGPSDA